MSNPIKLSVEEKTGFSVVSFTIDGGSCSPSDLQGLEIPEVPGNQGIVLNGRGPIWLYGFLGHHFHVSQWLAFSDPRLGGAVVVSSHTPGGVSVGDIIPIEGK